VVSTSPFHLSAQSNLPLGNAPVSYANEAVVIERYDTTFRYNADGTGDKDVSIRVKIQNEAGARQFSVLSFPFAAATESPKIVSLIVHHSDGTTTETPSSDAMEMPAPVTQQAPLYSDLKMLQIPVRSLRAADVLEYTIRFQRKNPEAPGQFWDNTFFLSKVVVLSESLTLDVPSEKYVQQWSAKIKPSISESGGRRVFVWQTSQLKPTTSAQNAGNEATEKPKPVQPDVAWTTFHSWAEVGEWYRSLAEPRAVPTDAIRAQADEITREAKTPEAQVQALYSFVATRIRYVGIDFGVGRYQPHAASEVLATQYGDCKDKDTLFEALLRAKGLLSAPALIGANLELVPELPSPAFFNHVITTVTVPSGRVWADTTPGITPYRLLLPQLRDKQALAIPLTGSASLERTPAETPFPFSDRFEAVAKLTRDGELTGHVEVSYRSDSEILVRAIVLNLAPAQWDQGTQVLANALGFSGTTSNSRFDRADDLAHPMHFSYDYKRSPFGDWDNFRIIPLFPANTLPAAPSKEPEDSIDLGAPRTEQDVSRIQLPEGFGADLPDAIHVKTPFATFDKTYKLENGELIAERDIAVLASKVPIKSWEEYKKFADAISQGEENWIQLTAKSTSGTGPQPPRPGENNPAAAVLVTEAVNLEKMPDWPAALEKLDEAKKLNSEQPFLWSNYGYIAIMRNRGDEAKTDFRHELSHHPDESFVVKLYASFLTSQREFDEATSVLQSSFDRDPSEPTVAAMLASSQSRTDMKQAIATLRKADTAGPNNPTVLEALVNLLINDNQKGDACQIAGRLMSSAGDNPNLLNDAAYLLAEADGDLSKAEQSSRKSLDILETQTASADVSEANQQSFNRTSLLVASWDTLGYILIREKKFEDASDFLEAAWMNRPVPAIGLHYGQALEADGKIEPALRVYQIALSQLHGDPSISSDGRMLRDSIARLTSAGLKIDANLSSSAEKILQEDRTFKVTTTAPCKTFESSTLRMQISSAGEPEVLHVAGAKIEGSTADLFKKLSLPHLVPSGSKARILRDAVFTCSAGRTDGYLVLMPLGSIRAEQAGD
jgi:tetratricopeptide (TPR) repeat protein